MPAKPRHTDLREACVEEAFAIIEKSGVDKLSLREVARRLGVSHQAPYRHFGSRDDVLAEIISRAFAEFADYLADRPAGQPPSADLSNMGARYMEFAARHPLKYQLMFNTPVPEAAITADLQHNAQRAFAMLRDRLASMPLRPAGDQADAGALDAIFVWSTLHGLVSILQADALDGLGLTKAETRKAIERCFARLSLALDP